MTDKQWMWAKCRHCDKRIYSKHAGQLRYNIFAHQEACPLKDKEFPEAVELK